MNLARTVARIRSPNSTDTQLHYTIRSSSVNDVNKNKDQCITPDPDEEEQIKPLSLKYSQLPRVNPPEKQKETSKTNVPNDTSHRYKKNGNSNKYNNKQYLSKLNSSSPRQQHMTVIPYSHLHPTHFKSVDFAENI